MWIRATHSLFTQPMIPELTASVLVRCCASLPTRVHPETNLGVDGERQTMRGIKQKVLKRRDSPASKYEIQIHPPPSTMKSQSVILPGFEKVRACGAVEEPEKLLEYPDDETRTVYDVIYAGILKSKTGKCLGTRSPNDKEYEWVTYTEVLERSKYVGSGLINLGISSSQKSMVGICTKSRQEFILTMFGTSHHSMVLVPMFDCFDSEMLTLIVAEAGMEVIICETVKIANRVIENVKKCLHLKYLILIDETDISQLQSSSLKIMTFKELEHIGKSHIHDQKKPKPEDLFCLCYTSGTTGVPKGVMVSHRNVMSCIASMEAIMGEAIPEIGSLIAYLPCAHIYEIVNEIYCLYRGGEIGFYSGNPETLLNDIAVLKPTVVPLVPKLMNRIYSEVKKRIGPNLLKRYLFKLALLQKEKDLKRGIVSKTTIWDRLIFSQIHEIMGGAVQMIITASAPISKEVMRFFRCASGCLVFEAYGLSEVGAAAMTLMGEHDSGFVGPPLPSNHIKLVSVPELFYDADDNVGEICIRGPNVFGGYFKNPQATKEAIDKNGWHYTGDIGKWQPNGTLSIIDRKKHIFKLSQGEYIVPDKSENVYVQSHIISQIFVDAYSEEDFVIGIVIPDHNVFIEWAKENGFPENSLKSLCKDKNVKIEVLKHMVKAGKRKGLNSLHQVGNIYLSTEPFSQENGLLTPTLKLKRPEARKKYEGVIQELYEEGNLRKRLNL